MDKNILELLKNGTVEKNGLSCVSSFRCREIADGYGVKIREVEMLALENGICPLRYERSMGVFGLSGQMKILGSRVAVVGCGGLGGWIIEILARAGVGEIVMIDGDLFDESNLNRQLFSNESNMGMGKAEAAALRVRSINSAVSALPRNVFIDEANCRELISGCDAVADALDNNRARRLVYSCCRGLGIPFIHGAVGGYFGQAGVMTCGSYPFWEESGVPDKGMEREAGCPPFTPAFIASIEAAETLKVLTASDKIIKDVLLCFDLESGGLQKIKLDKKRFASEEFN